MSQGNAAAIRRRVKSAEVPKYSDLTTNTSTAYSPTSSAITPSNLSINDAFKLVNERIVNLEKGIHTSSSTNMSSEIISEYEDRFNLIAQEIGELKETVLKLQTFTMDVNKTLYDERVNIFSDIDKTKESNLNIESIDENIESIDENIESIDENIENAY